MLFIRKFFLKQALLLKKRIDYYLLSSKGLCHLEGIGFAARDNNDSQEGLKKKKTPLFKRYGVFNFQPAS